MKHLVVMALVLLAAGPAVAAPPETNILEVKFKEGLNIRLRGGVPVDVDGRALRGAVATQVLAQLRAGTWLRSHSMSEDQLLELKHRGEEQTGESLPDLNLYFRFTVPPGGSVEAAEAALRQLSEVEAVYRVATPPPLPIPPDYFTPATTRYQRYLDAAPDGVGIRPLPQANLNTERICDVEYSWNLNHGDLPTGIVQATAGGVDPFGNTNHGTAVLGVYGANAEAMPFGVTGGAAGAALVVSASNTAAGWNVGQAVTNCINQGSTIIVIEQQWNGPAAGDGDFIPSEWERAAYDAIRTAAANGIVVVAAAGNGSADLDDPLYDQGGGDQRPFRWDGTSGSILVGAGRSPYDGRLVRSAHDFSTYGSAVDLQGWGDGVVTLGYSDLYSIEGQNLWYTSTFSGTSSATPIVASAVAQLQTRARAATGVRLSPLMVKRLLKKHGTSQQQQSGRPRNIGPLPNTEAAVAVVQNGSRSWTLNDPIAYTGADGRYTAINDTHTTLNLASASHYRFSFAYDAFVTTSPTYMRLDIQLVVDYAVVATWSSGGNGWHASSYTVGLGPGTHTIWYQVRSQLISGPPVTGYIRGNPARFAAIPVAVDELNGWPLSQAISYTGNTGAFTLVKNSHTEFDALSSGTYGFEFAYSSFNTSSPTAMKVEVRLMIDGVERGRAMSPGNSAFTHRQNVWLGAGSHTVWYEVRSITWAGPPVTGTLHGNPGRVAVWFVGP